MVLVCFCCVSETVLTINRRWNLLFVGFANKEFSEYLTTLLAIAVGNKRLQPVDAQIRKGQVLGERLSRRVSQISAD